jgi:hypothetical protein
MITTVGTLSARVVGQCHRRRGDRPAIGEPLHHADIGKRIAFKASLPARRAKPKARETDCPLVRLKAMTGMPESEPAC